jgi:hypothetical protein
MGIERQALRCDFDVGDLDRFCIGHAPRFAACFLKRNGCLPGCETKVCQQRLECGSDVCSVPAARLIVWAVHHVSRREGDLTI